jgi:hypothetical protein
MRCENGCVKVIAEPVCQEAIPLARYLCIPTAGKPHNLDQVKTYKFLMLR